MFMNNVLVLINYLLHRFFSKYVTQLQKIMKIKLLSSFALLCCSINAYAQNSEDFDKVSLSTGNLACWESTYEQQIFTTARRAAATSQPISADSHLSLETTTPMNGSGSLRVQENISVPIFNSFFSSETLTTPTFGVDNDQVNFNVRVNSADLPSTAEYLDIFVRCGNYSDARRIELADIGNIININRTITNSQGGGVIQIEIRYQSYTVPETATSYAYSLDIDDYSTTAGLDPNNACLKSLPVSLITFSAKRSENVIHLNWAATEEINADYYEVQMSYDRNTWRALGKINTSTDIMPTKKYSFEYTGSPYQVTYYRLKMVDMDHTFAYSRIVSVNTEKSMLKVYPNPSSDFIHIPSGLGMTKIINTNGQLVMSRPITDKKVDIRPLKPGSYMVQYMDQNGQIVINRFMVER